MYNVILMSIQHTV